MTKVSRINRYGFVEPEILLNEHELSPETKGQLTRQVSELAIMLDSVRSDCRAPLDRKGIEKLNRKVADVSGRLAHLDSQVVDDVIAPHWRFNLGVARRALMAIRGLVV
jgi:hypothetical protein